MSLPDALAFCERAALRWLQRLIDERSPPLARGAMEISRDNQQAELDRPVNDLPVR
jgi:hypothetical protein